MTYFVLRGTARGVRPEKEALEGSNHSWDCMAFSKDRESALEAAHERLKEAGFITSTTDGDPIEVPAPLAEQDTEQGKTMREARKFGAVVVIAAEPGAPADIYDE